MDRILVVDDEPQVLAGIRRAIGRHFFIDGVSSVAQAIQRLARGERYAAILSDLAMADIDGLEFLEHARRLSPATPRIMLSGQADRSALVGAINRAGVTGFLQKPILPSALISALELAIAESPGARDGTEPAAVPWRSWLDRELASVCLDDQFNTLFQPRICTSSGQVAAAEALIRWNHPVRGPIPTAEFIPVAEASGQIDRITAWVIDKSARAWHRLRLAGADLPISVNVSPSALLTSELVDVISAVLASHAMPANRLEIEITEGHRLESTEAVRRTLASLRGIGVRIALDDFGMGYASFDTLRSLDIDILKIDRSFVAELATDIKHYTIVRSIIKLARSLKLTVIAEGVETRQQATLLNELRVQQLQGFFFAPAVTAEHLGSRELSVRIAQLASAWHPSHMNREA
jgi:EAL domain-containing protein (putative c-di-GMP-specific phosphodiesterase class I)/ActR/RegA family two-component response regulator